MRTFAIENSSNIQTIGYCPASRILLVRFNSGDLYEYLGVDEVNAAHIAFGESVGKEFNARVKKFPEKFPFKKVSDGRAVVSPAELVPCPVCAGTNPDCTHCTGLRMIPSDLANAL